MLNVKNCKADNIAQNKYFKILFDLLKNLLNNLSFENICDNDKLVSNEQFIKEFGSWIYQFKLDDKNNKFIDEEAS